MNPDDTSAARIIAEAMSVNTGGELEPITDVYKPDGCAIYILDRLHKAGFDVVPVDWRALADDLAAALTTAIEVGLLDVAVVDAVLARYWEARQGTQSAMSNENTTRQPSKTERETREANPETRPDTPAVEINEGDVNIEPNRPGTDH